MRPQNYVCVLVTSSGITFISSFISFSLRYFMQKITQHCPSLYTFHLVVLICLFCRGCMVDNPANAIHQIRARALCTSLASALERAQFENLCSQHHALHGGVAIPVLWHGPPCGEPDLNEVQISCAPFIGMELHDFNKNKNICLYMTIPTIQVELVNKKKITKYLNIFVYLTEDMNGNAQTSCKVSCPLPRRWTKLAQYCTFVMSFLLCSTKIIRKKHC